MAAEARHLDPDLTDPAEILRLLPDQYRAQFLHEYAVAIEDARRPEHYRMLLELLGLWRLRAVAYSDPAFTSRRSAARSAADDDVTAEQVAPGWPR